MRAPTAKPLAASHTRVGITRHQRTVPTITTYVA
jgi:hypothetical protein